MWQCCSWETKGVAGSWKVPSGGRDPRRAPRTWGSVKSAWVAADRLARNCSGTKCVVWNLGPRKAEVFGIRQTRNLLHFCCVLIPAANSSKFPISIFVELIILVYFSSLSESCLTDTSSMRTAICLNLSVYTQCISPRKIWPKCTFFNLKRRKKCSMVKTLSLERLALISKKL